MKKIRGKEIIKEYLNFAESLNNEDLKSLRSHFNKKTIIQMLQVRSGLIVSFKNNKDNYNLFTFLSTNIDNSKNFIDNKNLRKEYDNGSSYADSFKKSIGNFFTNEIEECFYLSAPDHPMVRQDFVKYQKTLREKKKLFSKEIENNNFIPFDYSFGNINDIRKLTNEQKINREKMLDLKNIDQEKFNILWVRGDYHLATIVARLEHTKNQETLMMREEILNKNQISVEIKDYGLTITEIFNGLQIANKSIEKYLYKAFVEGNINLKAMVLIIRNINIIDENDKGLSIKVIQSLANDFDMRKKEDLDKYILVRKFIKKYNLPTHNNWKKEL